MWSRCRVVEREKPAERSRKLADGGYGRSADMHELALSSNSSKLQTLRVIKAQAEIKNYYQGVNMAQRNRLPKVSGREPGSLGLEAEDVPPYYKATTFWQAN